MKKVTKIVIGSVATVIAVVGISGFAMAKHYGGSHGMMGKFMIYKLDKQLELNDSQVDQLKSIQTYVQAKHATHKKQDHRAEFKKLLSQPVLDQQQIISMMEQTLQEIRGNAPEMISKIAAFTDTLSTEQRAELIEMMDKMSHRGHHRSRHMQQEK